MDDRTLKLLESVEPEKKQPLRHKRHKAANTNRAGSKRLFPKPWVITGGMKKP